MSNSKRREDSKRRDTIIEESTPSEMIDSIHSTINNYETDSNKRISKLFERASIEGMIEDLDGKSIAIVGMACRFPGADNYNEFWKNLENGINSIREIPADRWSIDEYYSPNISEPNKSISKWGGFLENIDQFDNYFLIFPRVKQTAWILSRDY